eukprot:s6791_g2.t1
MEPQVLEDALLAAPLEEALTVIGDLLKARPLVAPSIVGFASPNLTYAPARGLSVHRACGILKSFSTKTGFGFIASPELLEVFATDVFVHSNQMRPYAAVLAPGTPVTFAVALGKEMHENKPQAFDVQPLDGVLAQTAHTAIFSGHGEAFWASMSAGRMVGVGDVYPGGPCGPRGNTLVSSAKRKWQDADAELGHFMGRIKAFNAEKGFGFIVSEELASLGYLEDVFLLAKDAPRPTCEAGHVVAFKAFLNSRGHPQAKDVELR